MKRIFFLVLTLAALQTVSAPAQISESYTYNVNLGVPDGNPTGLLNVQQINSAITLLNSVQVRLTLNGTFNGDLYVTLTHESGFSVLLNRTGRTSTNAFGYPDDGFSIALTDTAMNGDVHVYRNVSTPNPGSPLTGTWQPDARNADPDAVTDASPRTAFLSSFNGLNANGQWRLFVADLSTGEAHTLVSWGLDLQGVPEPSTTSLVIGSLLLLAWRAKRSRS